MRTFILGSCLSLSMSTVAAHEFGDVSDISALNAPELNRRCVALMSFFSGGLRLDTVEFDFDYPGGTGPDVKAMILENLGEAFQYHAFGVAADLHATEGPTPEGDDIGVRIRAKVGPETEMYRNALAGAGPADSSGLLPMRQEAEARKLLSHDLQHCVFEFAASQLLR